MNVGNSPSPNSNHVPRLTCRQVHTKLEAQEEAARSIQKAFRKRQRAKHHRAYAFPHPVMTNTKLDFGMVARDKKLMGPAGASGRTAGRTAERTPSAAIASAPASRSASAKPDRPSVGWRAVKASQSRSSPSSPGSLPRPASVDPHRAPSKPRDVVQSLRSLAQPAAESRATSGAFKDKYKTGRSLGQGPSLKCWRRPRRRAAKS